MKFEVEFSRQATRFIRNLQTNIKGRIKKKFGEVSEDPFRFLEHYECKEEYKLRIGNYRALIDVDSERKILWVRIFDKRGRIYKR